MKMVVGLGNPGTKYDGTPHNIGFEVVDELVRASGSRLKKSWRFPLESAQVRLGSQDVLLVKPQTFMNRSGDAVGPLIRKKGITPQDVLVIVDDVDLPTGTLRLRARGSAGSHNGLRSLIERLGTTEFPRMRVGVGPVPEGQDRVAFVLGRYREEVRKVVANTLVRAADAAGLWAEEGLEKAMNSFNGQEIGKESRPDGSDAENKK